MKVTTSTVLDTGDDRGSSFPLNDEIVDFLLQARGCHVATIAPTKIRGNHYHRVQKEIIFVRQGASWILHWDEGDESETFHRAFSGRESVVIRIQPGASHAVENTGTEPLLMVGLSSACYDADNPDAYKRQVTPPKSLHEIFSAEQ